MKLLLGDCVGVMRELPKESVDTVVTDPPYNLAILGQEWDTCRYYQKWCEEWGAEAYRLLKPGGHLIAFGGRRTSHRMVCGLEDAGFEIRDCLLWLYSSGFPKGNVLKPAWEPMVLARKEMSGTIEETVSRYGTGALNTEATAVGDGERWPANLLLSHDLNCVFKGYVVMPGRKMNRYVDGPKPFGGGKGHMSVQETMPDEQVEVWDCVPGCPVEQVGPDARFFYCSKPSVAEQNAGTDGNHHPTVKPINLMRWLIKLSVPGNGVILDPFMGSGTAAVAALLEKRTFIGIELNSGYMRVAMERAQYWEQHGEDGWRIAMEKEAAAAKRERMRAAGQLDLMDMM
jgi:site-specific DNA-methyltransferase (adenine-specific)